MSHLQRQIKSNSIQTNIDTFIKDLTHLECYQLVLYLSNRYMTEEPNEIQKKFVDEFFDIHEWLKFISIEKESEQGKTKYFYRPPFDLNNVRTILMFTVILRMPDILMENSNLTVHKTEEELKKIDLKIKLVLAFQNSHENGIFNKIEGWCNISEVLVEEKLLILPKESE